MPDDTRSPGGQEHARINVDEDEEVHAWAGKFGVTPDEVRHAVKEVGDRADAVQEYLHAHHWSPGK